MPVVAGAATVAALFAGGIPTGTAPAPPAVVAPTSPPTPTTTTPAVLAAPASYQLRDVTDLPQCPADAKGAPIGKTDAGVWYWTKEETCVLVVVDWADTNPHHKGGGWIVLTAAADVPPDEYVKLIIPSKCEAVSA